MAGDRGQTPVLDLLPDEKAERFLLGVHAGYWRWLPFESHDGVAERGNRALSDAPVIALTFVYRAVGLATLQNHPHAWHTGEPPQEVLIEIGVVRAHHDEHLGIRK